MNPHNLVQRNSEKAKGVVLPEILLASGWKLLQVIEAFYIIWRNTCLLEFIAVKWNAIVDLLCDALEPLELQLFQLTSFH